MLHADWTHKWTFPVFSPILKHGFHDFGRYFKEIYHCDQLSLAVNAMKLFILSVINTTAIENMYINDKNKLRFFFFIFSSIDKLLHKICRTE